ncbi:hypothetical protein BC941DRAFT_467428 [Chlamydoabsidia padenii]|nr:hypothetical protein BC941DRAFT_467428 [Chlamydoabsidia padenii]
MNTSEPLVFSFDNHFNTSFAADLLSQFDLKRQQLYSTNTPDDLPTTTKQHASDEDSSDSLKANDINSPDDDSIHIPQVIPPIQTLVEQQNHATESKPVEPTPTPLDQHQQSTDAMSSPHHPNKSKADTNNDHDEKSFYRNSGSIIDNHTEENIPSPLLLPTITNPPASNASPLPCRYPPKPLHYSPIVDPPNDRHRASFPWRRKSTIIEPMRRQSEPGDSRQRVKGRRSFFF